VTLTVADIERWNAGDVREFAEAGRARAAAATDAAEALKVLPAFATWGGTAADAARQAIGGTAQALDAHSDQALAAARAADTAADGIEKVQGELRNLEDEAASLRMVIDPVTDTVAPAPGFFGSLAAQEMVVGQLQAALDAIVAEANDVDAELAQAINIADGKMPVPEAPAPPLPPPNAQAADVNKWWESLSPDEKQREIAQHPDVIGNLNGVPISARNDANLRVLNADLSRVNDIARRFGVSADDVVKDPAKYGLSATDVTRFHNAVETQNGLRLDAGKDPHQPNPTFLFAYQPEAFGGKGRAAIAIGNPDTSPNTAVIVPGTSSSVKSGWLHGDPSDALNLYQQANKADPANPTAVLAWMGYDAPNDFSDPRIANPDLARAGGDALAADVNGLWVTHEGTSHVTVLGHSYGSTTVADAFARSGMHANDAVLLGCPGTDAAHSAADFHLDGGKLYVGDASTDLVGWLGDTNVLHSVVNAPMADPLGYSIGLGQDPAGDLFGATRFHAEVPGSDGLNANHPHSHYYVMGSEALRSMTDIVSGHGDALASEGLIAGTRIEPQTLSGPSQVDVPGLGRVNIPHIDIPVGPPVVYDPEWGRPAGSIHDDHQYR